MADQVTMDFFLRVAQDLGGYGIAALMFWMWKQEREERIRNRDVVEKVIGEDVPALTVALRDLKNEVAIRNQRSISPGP